MDDETAAPRRIKEPSYPDAIIPLVTLAVLIGGSVFLYGTAAIDGPLQVALILSLVVASLIIVKNGHTWDDIAKAEHKAIGSVVTAIFILLAVGALIGAPDRAKCCTPPSTYSPRPRDRSSPAGRPLKPGRSWPRWKGMR